MFDNYKKLSEEIKTLREEVFGEPGKEKNDRIGLLDMYSLSFHGRHYQFSLKDEVKSLEKNIERYQKLTSLLLNHFNLEYVKLTEENGSTKVKETLRKKKVKKGRKKSNDYDYDYDYND